MQANANGGRSEEHTSELQSLRHLVCRLLLEKKKARHRQRAVRAGQDEGGAEGPRRRRAPRPLFFFYGDGDHRDLHSFPTRRSSDLAEVLSEQNLMCARNEDLCQLDEPVVEGDRKSTRLNSSHLGTSYAVFCLKK